MHCTGRMHCARLVTTIPTSLSWICHVLRTSDTCRLWQSGHDFHYPLLKTTRHFHHEPHSRVRSALCLHHNNYMTKSLGQIYHTDQTILYQFKWYLTLWKQPKCPSTSSEPGGKQWQHGMRGWGYYGYAITTYIIWDQSAGVTVK